MTRTARLALILLTATAPALCGCVATAVVGAAVDVGAAAVGTTAKVAGAAAGATVDATGAVVRTATGSGKKNR